METQEIKKPNGAPPPELARPKNLIQKLCEVMAAVGYLQKKGKNEKQEYNYIREADVVAKMRDEFAKRNVFIFPTLVSHERAKLSRIEYDKVKESYVTDVVMRWTFVDGDSGEERVCDIPGCSASPGDKGVYVAMTGSEKYLLMKSFLLPTGDDPEDDANEPAGTKEAAQEVARKGLEEKAKSPDPKIRQMAQDGLAAIRAKEQAKAPSLEGALKQSIAAVPKAHIPLQESLESAKNDGMFDEIGGVIQQVREMVTTPAKGSKPYRRIALAVVNKADGEMKDIELVSWDNLLLSDGKLWDYLENVTDSPAVFLCEVSEYKGKPSYTVRDVKAIGMHSWDARVGAIQQGAR